jgi:HD-GYP domain-containing protein (c-di-GMP phosphodiesterase class II)
VLFRSNRHAILELSGLKSYDEYTYFHSVNVTVLSLTLGSAITQSQRFLSALGCGALMHDLGKVVIDVDVLNKPGDLSPDDWSRIQEHPMQGAEVAARVPGLDRAAVVAILEHHMRYDLNGYPVVKSAPPRPHLASRILGITDAYDAMTSFRTYSPARLQPEAMEVLVDGMGTAFDPTLVKFFINTLGAYPPRSVVRLSDGDVAVVVSANSEDIVRPKVRAIADASGILHEPVDIDLLGDPETRQIVGCLDPAGLDIDIEDFLTGLSVGAGAPGSALATADPATQPQTSY